MRRIINNKNNNLNNEDDDNILRNMNSILAEEELELEEEEEEDMVSYENISLDNKLIKSTKNNFFEKSIPETPMSFKGKHETGRTFSYDEYYEKTTGRSTSFDIAPFAGPPKKLKPSPCDIDGMPDTPQKESHSYEDNNTSISLTSRFYKDYDMINLLGSGSFGTVFHVKGKIDGVGYAIKKSRKKAHGQHQRSSMMHEVQALAALSAKEDSEQTSCIVRYYSAWVEDGYLCIQMELCEASAGNSIAFDHNAAYRLLRDMLNALDVLHSNDFVHLDIKPANILLKQNRYKLADFGLALHTTNRKFNGNIEEGDSRYMARELLDWGEIADLTKCDIFSLGISVYELYTRDSLDANGPKWHSIRDGIIPLPLDTPEKLSSIIIQLMSPEPTQRPTAKSCIELFTELKTPLEIELEKQRNIALKLEQELQQLMNSQLYIGEQHQQK